jgi:hypothetical protein
MADQVQALFKADADLMDYFNRVFAGGKWNHFMDQVHIGYTMWQDPPRNVMPKVSRLQFPDSAAMGVAVEGSTSAWPGTSGVPALPRFDRHGAQRHYLEVFNKGKSSFEFTAAPSAPWIALSQPRGIVDKEIRIWVSINWPKAARGTSSGFVDISRRGGESIRVKVESSTRERRLSSRQIHRRMDLSRWKRSIRQHQLARLDGIKSKVWADLSAMSILPVTTPVRRRRKFAAP